MLSSLESALSMIRFKNNLKFLVRLLQKAGIYIYIYTRQFIIDFRQFLASFSRYLFKNLHISFIKFETIKGIFVTILYRQRGKYAKRFMHSGMASLAALGIIIAPVIAQEFPGRSVDPWEIPSPSSVLSASTQDPQTTTLISEKMRDKIIEYTVNEGDTISSIADKFGVSQETILWQNNLGAKDKIKPSQIIEVLPVTGVSHKVAKGDTISSIAKKYDSSAQAIIDFPYNTFVNDETFELAISQTTIVPEGIRPAEKPRAPRIRRLTPDAGTVVASGRFVWPAGGRITQNYHWYHKGIDIASKASPNIVAADSGTVIAAGWPNGWGYGNKVEIDHGNGYVTLYAHLSSIYVVVGQTVSRGNAIGRMGCTGRCSGTHLHFEVKRNGVYLNPFTVLQ